MKGIWRGKPQIVIIPNHKQIAFGTFQSMLNQAGITPEELKPFIK